MPFKTHKNTYKFAIKLKISKINKSMPAREAYTLNLLNFFFKYIIPAVKFDANSRKKQEKYNDAVYGIKCITVNIMRQRP